MNKFRFGKRSIEQLSTCHEDLVLIAQETLKHSNVDFGISEGHRSEADQLKYFLKGYSRIDPRVMKLKLKGKHLSLPSDAFDIYIYVKGDPTMTYDKESLAYVGGVIMTTASRLYEERKVNSRIRWGGNWDSDGTIIKDQNLKDYPHFERLRS